MPNSLEVFWSGGTIPAGCVTAFLAFGLGRLSRKGQARLEALGKRQMEDLLAIRDLAYMAGQETRAAVAYARSSGELQRERLNAELGDFSDTVLFHARSLPVRQYRRMRALLVRLEGESGVHLPEDLGSSWVRTEPYGHSLFEPPAPGSARDGWCEELTARGVDLSCGLLCLHGDSIEPLERVLDRLKRASLVLDELLREAGGRAHLPPRNPGKVILGRLVRSLPGSRMLAIEDPTVSVSRARRETGVSDGAHSPVA